jgi:hypothetical protein
VECHHGTRCPYVSGGDVWRLIGERDYLSQWIDEMGKVMAMSQVEIAKLRQEPQNLKEEREKLGYQLKQMLGKIFKPRIETSPEVNRPKRGAPCGHRGNSRRRPEEITEFIEIYTDKCDECGGKIEVYEESFDEHVVEDIEIKKKVTCYRLHYGYCKQCKRVVCPKAKEAVNPSDRIGVQARAVGGYLRYLGLPYRKVAKIFKDVFDLNLTHPSFLAFNTEQAQNGASLYEAIKESIRHSPYVNADETGWRVDGDNHWLWVFTNKDAALYQIDKSRGSKVVGDILGEKYQGTLISDFYRKGARIPVQLAGGMNRKGGVARSFCP